MSKHTPGPWRWMNNLCLVADHGNRPVVLSACTHEGFPSLVENQGGILEDIDTSGPNARLIAAAPELLEELKKANQIIINALNVMSQEQVVKWGEKNDHDGLKDGWAVTRNNAREAVIRKAEGK